MSGLKYVTKDFCDEREKRIFDKLEAIDKKIDAIIAQKLAEAGLATNNKRRSRDALRVFLYALLGGLIVALLEFLLTHVH
jgi:hypothetical protein